jgi:REP element-mobilizing transposase RayT
MSRQLRVLFPGALYHAMARGNERQRIFRSDDDRLTFLDLLGAVDKRYGAICHAYCLMENHFHFVVETPRGNLPEIMHHLNGCYAQRFNQRWDRVGHLFQGRYKGVLVERDAYLLEVVRYVLLNPVRGNRCELPEEWRWSSCRALLGVGPRPSWLSNRWLLDQLAPDVRRARERWRDFLHEGIARPTPLPIRADSYLAEDPFLLTRLADQPPHVEIPRAQWQPVRPTLAEIFASSRDPARDAHERYGYTFREIGEHVGRHYSTISRRLQRSARRVA